MPNLRKQLNQIIDSRSSEWLDRQVVRLGDLEGQVLTETSGVLYARQVNGKVIRAYNAAQVPATFDLQVLVGRDRNLPNVWQIIAIRETYGTPAGGGQLAFHHTQHEFPNSDTVWIDRKQIVPLTVLVHDAANFIVRVFGSIVHTANGIRIINTQLIDLSSYVITSGAKFVSIESDGDGDLSVHDGTVFAAPDVGAYTDIPVPDPGKYLVAFILLHEGQEELSDDDIRVPFPLAIVQDLTHSHSVDASGVTYTPSDVTDWDADTDPGNTDDALDQLVERLRVVEETGGEGEGAPGHAHGLARWNGASGQTTFELPDVAEYIDSVMLNGLEEDSFVHSLSADGSQIILDSALTSATTVTAHYVIAGV
jgi:hypothetical protein